MDLKESRSTSTRRHPWETARFQFFAGIVARVRPAAILDVGSGDAWLASGLADRIGGPVTVDCLDTAYTPEVIRDLESRNSRALRYFSTMPAETYELVLLLDVLEHVNDDLGYLKSIVSEHVRPGGRVLVSVPA